MHARPHLIRLPKFCKASGAGTARLADLKGSILPQPTAQFGQGADMFRRDHSVKRNEAFRLLALAEGPLPFGTGCHHSISRYK